MASTVREQIHSIVYIELVTCVKAVVRGHAFTKDAWFNFCHEHAPGDVEHGNATLDPFAYSAAFLGDFLQYVSVLCKDEDAIEQFTDRKAGKVRRVVREVSSFPDSAVREVENVWIVVGESVLYGAKPLACQCQEVRLPSDLVHHSGVAVAMLLGCISSGVVSHRLRIRLASSFCFGCLHFEGKFSQWPLSRTQLAFHDRIDNLNHVLRAWGVDAKATRQALGLPVRSNLHPRLQHFVGVGVGGRDEMPCFHIDPDRLLASLVKRGKMALYDGLMVQELYEASYGRDNGIATWFAERDSCVLSDVLQYYNLDNSTTLVLVLSPRGILLEPPTGTERKQPGDIWFQ